uniref:CSON001548 protein n=1 Tax=Culicoides sonorensis TaxID=179676 RepID=A0A336MHY9_CULSO
MDLLEKQLSEVSLVYTEFERNLTKEVEALQNKINDLITKSDAEATPNPKGKRAKHMQTICDDPEGESEDAFEETSNFGDTSSESQRPQRSTRNKAATSYKEPALNTKVRRPISPGKIKKERISELGKENTAPNAILDEGVAILSDKEDESRSKARLTNKKSNQVKADEPQKRKSKDEGFGSGRSEEGAKKLSDADAIVVIESPQEPVTVLSDDETEKMPPPAMPPPKTRGRPRTRKAAKENETAQEDDASKRVTKSRVKQERSSFEESDGVVSEISQQTTRSTRTKSKKKEVPKPIQILAIKQEKVSMENPPKGRTSASITSDASVYEDAQQGTSKNASDNPITGLDATYTKPITPNSTVTLENATFNVAKNSMNNDTFQVQSPQEVNGTYVVPTPNPHDSIMTEDRSDEEATPAVKKVASVKPVQSEPVLGKNGKPHVPNSKKYEIFNPNIPSPIKAKVQAFEKFTAASSQASNGFMSPNRVRMPPTRQIMTPSGSKIATPLSLSRIPNGKLSHSNTPLLQSISAPVGTKALSASKLAHVQKKTVPKHSTTSSASSRDPSVEDLKRTTAAIADKKKAREEKARLAQIHREQMDKERRERAEQQQKEKEEKYRKLVQEKLERKRELMNQKKLEEHLRNQKIMEQKRRELAEREALEAAKAKANESLQRKVLQKQHAKHLTKHEFETLDTDDSTDDEGKMNKNRGPPPLWSKGSLRRQIVREQAYVNLKLVDTLFSVRPMTVDLKEIFPTIEPKKLKRNSSAIWNTPPRYSQIPKY